jgi:hypothetical protein
MARYTPPEQSKAMQFVDIIFLVIAIFAALWLPLQAGWAGAAKSIDKIDNPTWETLKQTPAMVEQWVKLGYADAAAAHDVIQNKFHYDINWLQLIIMASEEDIMWVGLSYLCWAVSAILAAWMLYDWFQTDSNYSEDMLTSSREGEIEAVSEKHKI